MGNKDVMQDILQKLEQGVKDVFTSENYKKYLNVMSSFHQYSVNNLILIAAQKPDATLVAGYNAWQEKKRQVLKGEKAIRILAPQTVTNKEEREVVKKDEKGNPIFEHGKPVTERKTVEIKHTTFTPVSVFDISQTRGEALPSLAKELKGNISEKEKQAIMGAIKNVVGIPIETSSLLTGNTKGYYNPSEQKIVIKANMSDIQTIKTCIHEAAHKLLHDPKENILAAADKRSIKEVQAESVAYVVTKKIGIDTSDYSFGYIASWSEGKDLKELKESLNAIKKASDKIINEIQKELDKIKTIGMRVEKGVHRSSYADQILYMEKSDVITRKELTEKLLKEAKAGLEQAKKEYEINDKLCQKEKELLAGVKKDFEKYIDLSNQKDKKGAELQRTHIKEKYGINSIQDYNERVQKQIDRQEFLQYDKDALNVKIAHIKSLEADLKNLQEHADKFMLKEVKGKLGKDLPNIEMLSKAEIKTLYEFTKEYPNVKSYEGVKELKSSIDSKAAEIKGKIVAIDDKAVRLNLKEQLANLNPTIKGITKVTAIFDKMMSKAREMNQKAVGFDREM